MAGCTLRNDLCKRHETHLELSFDFTPEEIIHSAIRNGCDSCLIIHEGLCPTPSAHWLSLLPIVKRVFAQCHGEHGGHTDTLHLVVVFVDNTPPLQLEYYSLQSQGMTPSSIISNLEVPRPE